MSKKKKRLSLLRCVLRYQPVLWVLGMILCLLWTATLLQALGYPVLEPPPATRELVDAVAIVTAPCLLLFVLTTRRVWQLLRDGVRVKARVLDVGVSAKGYTRLQLQYKCGGEPITTWASLGYRVASDARDTGRIMLLVDPDRPSRWMLAPD